MSTLPNFEFATAGRVIFGEGTSAQIGTHARAFGTRALIVTGSSTARADEIRSRLEAEGVACAIFSVNGEPTIAIAQEGVETARAHGAELIIGIGGGAAIDTGKAISALLTNPGHPLDYLEVIGRGQKLSIPAAPYIAIPTTAGTGAEVTTNAVLASPEHRVKVSLRSPSMLPRVAIVDPLLTHGLPASVTARTGMDAITQLIEPFVSNKANPLTDAIAREGLRIGAPMLRRTFHGAVSGQEDAEAREAMALASLFGGFALANAKLGAVHGFAAPIGGMFDAPHGAICAALLPGVMKANLKALRERAPQSQTLARYDEVAKLITGNPHATADDGAAWAREMAQALDIPTLGTYGIQASDVADVVEKAAVASSMQGNPIKLTTDELTEILTQAL